MQISRPAIIYLATNQINQKRYVGFTTNTLARRRYQHSYDAKRKDRRTDTLFYRAIRKYGIEAFSFEIIKESNDAENLLREWEPKLILEYQSNDRRYGYNTCSGGRGRIGCTPWNKGVPRTDEVKEKLRQAHTGRKQTSETIDKRNAKLKGKKRSDDTRLRMAGEWLLQTPDGQSLTIMNLSRFCKDHDLTLSCMINVANGKRRHHKGYGCSRLALGPQSRLKSTPGDLCQDILI